jgi:phosphatidylserine/phosphatidylglycerophosphate/cardiolipin synthase-like enzyme
MAHARLIIFDEDAVIITSADLDVEGLDNQRQIGIYTIDKNIIRTCKTFFNRLWEEASSS